MIIRQELKAGQTSKCGDVLILLADGLLEEIYLDMAGLLGKLAGMHQVLSVSVQGLQERSGETS